MSDRKDGGPAFPEVRVREGDNYRAPVKIYYPGMSLREYAAIKLKVPNSGTEWLDDMIRESLRNELAAKAMQGFLAAQIYGFNDRPAKGPFASMAYEMADAMLAQQTAKKEVQ